MKPRWIGDKFGGHMRKIHKRFSLSLEVLFPQRQIFLFFLLILATCFLLPAQSYSATASSVNQFGITWTFDKAYTIGQFANGDYWVIGTVTIIGINPPSTSVSGRVKNGSMLNPSPTNDNQGYDSAMLNYQSVLNVAYQVNAANPLVISPSKSLVSTISDPETNDPPYGKRPQIQTCAVLTILSSAPLAGSFRPPYAGTDKTVKFNKSQLNYSLLAKLPLLPNTPRLKQQAGDAQNASVERIFERPWLDHRWGWYSDWYHPDYNMENYGRDLSTQVGIGALALNSNYIDAEKETLLIRMCQLGIDNYGVYQAGCFYAWEPDGGTASGRKFPILLAGIVLNDSSMGNIGQHAINDPYFGEDAQTFYVQQTSSGVYNYGYGGYTSADVGLPEWGIRHAHYSDPPGYRYDDKTWDSGYRRCCTANSWGGFVLATLAMNAKAEWGHNALFDYMDRYMATEPKGDFRQWNPWVEDMWDTYRAQFGPIWPNTSPTNQRPTANAGPDQTVNDSDGNGSQSVILNASASTDPDGTITSYVWKEGSTQIATGRTPTVTLSIATHTITLTVTDNGGLTATDTVVITITPRDSTPPSIVSVTAYKNSVEILFNEGLNQSSAQTVANYSISNGITVSAAALNTQYNTVTLTTSNHTDNISYTLTVTNVRDAAGNTMPSTTQTYQYSAGLIGYWRFDDASGTTAFDSSTRGNNGSLIGQPLWVAGKFASALDFAAADQGVEVPTNGMNLTRGTITLWAKPGSFPAVTQFMFAHVANGWANRIQIYTDNTQGGLGIGLGDTHKKHTNIFNLPINSWTHIALTWNGTNYIVYVNGTQSATGTYTGLATLSTYADIANTGNRSDRSEAFDGIIDDVRIYNRALAASEILDVYQSVPYLAFYPIGDKQVNEGQTLTFTVQTIEPSTQVQLESHNLPTQPTFTNNTFNWTPSYDAAGSYEATFVAPVGQLEDFETITITVNNVNRAPVLLTIPNKSVTATQYLAFAINAVDPDGDAITYSAMNLPAGAALSGKTFTWTPTIAQVGTYQVTFVASDGSLQDSQVVTITVSNTVPPLEQGLVGYWKLNEGSGQNTANSAPTGGAGTLIYQPPWVTGKFSTALRFQTLDQAVEIPSNGMSLGQGTIAMWANPTSFPNVAQFLFGHVSGGWANRIQIYTNNTSGALGIGIGDSHTKKNGIYNLPKNAWTHIALTWNSTSYVVYVNGTQRATGTYSGLSSLSTYADIGNTGYRSDRHEAFMGSIDDVRIYNRALSSSEISGVYSYQP